MRKSTLEELKAQRARIAGEGGFRWVKRNPFGSPARCCIVAWADRNDEGGASHVVGTEAFALLNKEVIDQFHVKPRTSADPAVYFNDHSKHATKKSVLGIFDTIIARLEK